MENEIVLHNTQVEALDFMETSINNNERIIALIGAGGTGKSEILSRLLERDLNKNIVVSASTNKAVSRLKKDIKEVFTLHSAVAKPKYTQLYINLEAYFNGLNECEEDKVENFKEIYYFTKESNDFIKNNHINLDEHRTILDLISHLGKTIFDPEFFDRYITKDFKPNTVLAIDEASMVPLESKYYNNSLVTIGVDTALKVFENVILIGDNKQLSPIEGETSFDDIPSYELTKNFRSEKDLLRAIQWAREGNDFLDYKVNKEENVKIVTGITNAWYDKTFKKDNVVHIVYTNKTRKSIIHKIRKSSSSSPLNNEPILYRGSSKGYLAKGEIGLYNNNEIIFDNISLRLKEYDNFDEYNEKKYCIFQYGYAMTAHMAQGSSIDHVIVHLYDIPYFIKKEEREKWIYTAISRGRKSITIIV